MATRGYVVIRENEKEVLLYNHYDSYPSGLGETLKDVLSGTIEMTTSGIQEKLELEVIETPPGDAEYKYTIDLDNRTLHGYKLLANNQVQPVLYEEIQISSMEKDMKKIVDAWKDGQIPIIIEELGELITAIMHYRRGKILKKDLLSEIADVRIVLKQLQIICDIHELDVQDEMKFKLKRTIDKIEK